MKLENVQDELLEAWLRWDERPGNEDTANRMVDACQEAAKVVGLNENTLRIRITQERVEGHAHEDIVNKLFGKPLRPHAYVRTNAPETSRQAAKKAVKKSTVDQRRILDLLTDLGEQGATDQQIARTLGMEENTVRPRRKELEEAGRIRKAPKKRKTESNSWANVWVAR